MGRKDYRSIRNEARSRGNVRSSISDECPLIPTVCLGDRQLGVLLGRARAFSRSERPSARSERRSGQSERGSGRGEGAS